MSAIVLLEIAITLWNLSSGQIEFTTTTTTSTDCDSILTNEDFYNGTFRIRQAGTYCLGEDISMNPHPGSLADPNAIGAWFPVDEYKFPGSIRHDSGGWALGFFAAIAIEGNHITIDLKGYQIEMSEEFYIQQRWFNHIQIQNAAFNFGEGPANFGQTMNRLRHIIIRNGKLGRTSHNGIHGFDTDNVIVENLEIFDFEVAGIQFNGFENVTIRNCDIGPSSTEVPFWGYYSHAKFSLNGLETIPYKLDRYVRFNGDRILTVQQIYNRLRKSLDIAYRWRLGLSTKEDKEHPLYFISIKMFENEFELPDGSAVYGMIFNSKGLATQGFGDSPNKNYYSGQDLYIENVKIHGLQINMNELPGVYFDRCEGFFKNRDGTTSVTPIFGRFGDLFDIRRTLPHEKWDYIDKGFYSYDDLIYYGNPLSDAQIALTIFSFDNIHERTWGYQSTDDPSRGNNTFIQWATTSINPSSDYNSLPSCARFACNADAMFHTNKGLIGIRLDHIENVFIKDVYIYDLFNESPLGSLACGSYDGPNNGAQPKSLNKEGFMGTDIRGISIINNYGYGSGNVELYGNIKLSNFISNNGDVIGIHIMNQASVYIEDPNYVIFEDFVPGATITYNLYRGLKYNKFNPYPNNFYVCNIRAEHLKYRQYENYPHLYTSYGEGFIYPPGSIVCKCYELFYDVHGERRRRLIKYDY